MDSKAYGYFVLALMVLSVVAIFIGCVAVRGGKTFWATKLMLVGSLLLLIGTILSLGLMFESTTDYMTLGFIAAGLFGLGPIFFFIGFFGFCSRWGATGRRRNQLREITSALSAAQSANARSQETPST